MGHPFGIAKWVYDNLVCLFPEIITKIKYSYGVMKDVHFPSNFFIRMYSLMGPFPCSSYTVCMVCTRHFPSHTTSVILVTSGGYAAPWLGASTPRASMLYAPSGYSMFPTNN